MFHDVVGRLERTLEGIKRKQGRAGISSAPLFPLSAEPFTDKRRAYNWAVETWQLLSLACNKAWKKEEKKVEVKKNVFDAYSSIFFKEMHLLFFQQCHLQSPRICCLPRLSRILLRISYHMAMLSSTRKDPHGWHQEYFRMCFLTKWMESVCPVISHGPRKIIYLL